MFNPRLYEFQKQLSPEQIVGTEPVVLAKDRKRQEFWCEPQRNLWKVVLRLIGQGWKLEKPAVPKRRPEVEAKAKGPPARGRARGGRGPLAVAYYTDGYEKDACRLAKSLDAMGLEYEIDQRPDIGDWKANAHYRPWYLAQKRRQHPDRPLLSLDADCVLRRNPVPYLADLRCDVATHKWGEVWLPGTLWLKPTAGVDALLHRWQTRNEQGPQRYDRLNFTQAVADLPGLVVENLPPEYCFITDLSRQRFPNAKPVIEHFQASRKHERGRAPNKRYRIALLSYLATYGNAPLLAKGLESLGHDVRLIIRWPNTADREDYGFHTEHRCWQAQKPAERRQAAQWLQRAELVICIALPAVTWLLPRLLGTDLGAAIQWAAKRCGASIQTSSHWLKDPVKANAIVRDTGFARLAMPDLMPFVQSARYYWPPVADLGPNKSPLGRIGIAHSPGKESRRGRKGTAGIQQVMRRLVHTYGKRVRAQVLEGLPHDQAMQARRAFDVFVDQVADPRRVSGGPDWRGGIGKSGLEAMAAGCAVISSGEAADGTSTPEPPVVRTTPNGLHGELQRFVTHPQEAKALGSEAQKWVKLYCAPHHVAARIVAAAEQCASST